MFQSKRKHAQSSKKSEEPWLASSLKPENFVPGLVIGFLLGLFLDLSSSRGFGFRRNSSSSSSSSSKSISTKQRSSASDNSGEELKMVLVVRQDLRMGVGKIASQCAHAATGMYAELLQSHRLLLRQWEQYGQAKIVLSCKNQQEMNKLKEAADRCGLPTFVVADAGRTEERRRPLILLLGNCDFCSCAGSPKGIIQFINAT